MKKLIYLLFLLPFYLLAQNPTSFPYGVKITGGQPTNSTPVYFTCTELNGLQTKIASALIEKTANKQDNLNFDGTGVKYPTVDAVNNEVDYLQSTGILHGGVLSVNADPTKFDLSAGEGYIINSTDLSNVTRTKVTWTAKIAQTVTNIGTQTVTYVFVNSDGTLFQQATFPTVQQRRSKIFIGRLNHSNFTSITFTDTFPDMLQGIASQYFDLTNAIGPFSYSGNVITANGANLSINKTVGDSYNASFNYAIDNQSPNNINHPGITLASFRHQNRSTTDGSNITVIDPTNYDVGGVTTPVPNPTSTATAMRVYLFPSNTIRIQRGQAIYANLAAAIAGYKTETFVENPSNTGVAIWIATIVVQKNCTSLLDTSTSAILLEPKFGGSAGAAGISTATLQSAYNNSTTPEVVTNSTLGAFSVQRGSAADTNNIYEGQNGAGTVTYSVTGNGDIKTNGNISIGSTTLADNRFITISPSATGVPNIQGSRQGVGAQSINLQPQGGNVGIGLGAATPSARLEVVSSVGSDQVVVVQNSNTNGVSGIFHKDDAGTNSLTTGVVNSTSTLGATYGGAGEGIVRSSGNGLTFSGVNGNIRWITTSSGTERMRLVNTNGSLLIGTTTDNGVDRLQVSGSSLASVVKSTNDAVINGLSVGRGGGSVSGNTSVGISSLTSNTSGVGNSGFGSSTLTLVTTGGSNTAIGVSSLSKLTTGSGNTAIGGLDAGAYLSDGLTSNQTSNSSIFIGSGTKASAAGLTNEIVIGNGATGNGSNTVTIGHTSVVNTYLRGTVNGASFKTTGGTQHQTVNGDGSLRTGYKVYRVLLSQLSGNAPSVSDVENTLGVTVSATRNSIGTYTLTASAAIFQAGFTLIQFTNQSTSPNHTWTISRTGTATIVLRTYNSGTLADDVLNEGSLEIKVKQ